MKRSICVQEGPGWLDKPTRAQIDDCLDCPVRLECILYAIDCACTEVVMGGIKLGTTPIRKLED